MRCEICNEPASSLQLLAKDYNAYICMQHLKEFTEFILFDQTFEKFTMASDVLGHAIVSHTYLFNTVEEKALRYHELRKEVYQVCKNWITTKKKEYTAVL